MGMKTLYFTEGHLWDSVLSSLESLDLVNTHKNDSDACTLELSGLNKEQSIIANGGYVCEESFVGFEKHVGDTARSGSWYKHASSRTRRIGFDYDFWDSDWFLVDESEDNQTESSHEQLYERLGVGKGALRDLYSCNMMADCCSTPRRNQPHFDFSSCLSPIEQSAESIRFPILSGTHPTGQRTDWLENLTGSFTSQGTELNESFVPVVKSDDALKQVFNIHLSVRAFESLSDRNEKIPFLFSGERQVVRASRDTSSDSLSQKYRNFSNNISAIKIKETEKYRKQIDEIKKQIREREAIALAKEQKRKEDERQEFARIENEAREKMEKQKMEREKREREEREKVAREKTEKEEKARKEKETKEKIPVQGISPTHDVGSDLTAGKLSPEDEILNLLVNNPNINKSYVVRVAIDQIRWMRFYESSELSIIMSQDVKLKSFRVEMKRNLNMFINQLSSTTSHISLTCEKILKCLQDSKQMPLHPLIFNTRAAEMYGMYLLSQLLLGLSEGQLRANPMSVWSYATLAATICLKIPEFRTVLNASMHSACCYTIPFFYTKKQSMDMKQFVTLRGQRNEESEHQFFQRMIPILRLHLAILVCLKDFDSLWQWFSRMLNFQPPRRISTLAILSALEISAYFMLDNFKNQFKKLLSYIEVHTFPKLRVIRDKSSGDVGESLVASICKLENLIADFKKTNTIPIPEGMQMKAKSLDLRSDI